MTVPNAEDTLIKLLKDNWTSSNTSDRAPPLVVIDKRANHKASFTRKSDYIFTYEYAPMAVNANGIGTSTRKSDSFITIDIRTHFSEAHGRKLLDEVNRIVEGNIVNPDSDFQILEPIRIKDQSDKNSNFWRYVYDTKVSILNRGRP